MNRKITWLAVSVLALAGVFWQVKKDRINWCTADFPVFYAAGQLAGTPQLYSPDAVQSIHERETGCSVPSSMFVRLPYYAAALWPLGKVSFRSAWAIWIALSIAALLGYLWLWPGQCTWAALVLAWSFPLGYNFTNGKDIPFVLFFIALAAALLTRKKDTGAGMALALCSLKFHLFLLISVWIVFAGLWRVAKGLAIGGAALLAASFLIGGWNWPIRYLEILKDPRIDPGGPGGPQRALIRFLANFFGPEIVWEAFIAVAVVFAVALISRRAPMLVGLAAALIGGLLINRHVAPSDLALLIPAGFAIIRYTKAEWPQLVVIALLSPFPYLAALNLWPIAVLEIGLLFGLAYHYREAAATPASCENASR